MCMRYSDIESLVLRWQRARKLALTRRYGFSKEGSRTMSSIKPITFPASGQVQLDVSRNGPNGVKAVGSRRTRRALSVDKVWYRSGAQRRACSCRGVGAGDVQQGESEERRLDDE